VWIAPLCATVPHFGCDRTNANSAPPVFDAARAWQDLESIVALGSRISGSPGIEKTRELIERELSAAGLKPVRESFTATTPAGPIAMANVYADLPGDGTSAETVLLVTHFDAKRGIEPFQGANDSGSGTVVLLELARVLARGPTRPLTYRFLFVDGEEAIRWEWEGLDNTYGSRHHAEHLKKSGAAEKVRACVLLDIVGDKDLKLFRDTYSDKRLIDIFFGAARKIGLAAHVDGRQDAIKDDHLSFMNIGIPSIDLIDLDYGPHNSYWHTSKDTLENCSKESLAAIGRIVLAALPELEERFKRR
jgi:Zn-dependent M28 family amino/carboxypeptidase